MTSFDYSKLQELMKSQRWTVTNLAQSIGLSRVALSSKLNKGGNFTQKQIEDISKILKINPSDYHIYFFKNM